jgi:nickel transport protein
LKPEFLNFRKSLTVVAVLSSYIFFSTPAFAHRVTIFAWVEGNTVHTESKFSGGKRVNEGTVNVYNSAGTIIQSGKTNENGEYSFTAKEKGDLKIVIEAGMGHRGEWQMSEKDFAAPSDAPMDAAPIPEETAGTNQQPNMDHGKSSSAPVSPNSISAIQLEAIVEKAVEKKIAPLMAALAEAQDKEPSIRDIMGGIGYILGLMGIAAFVRYKRKSP